MAVLRLAGQRGAAGGDSLALVRLLHQGVTDGDHRRLVTSSHAGRPDSADVVSGLDGNLGQELLGAKHLAGQTVTNPDGDCRRRRLVLANHVEMGVEARNLIDLGHGHPHLMCQSRQMRCGNMAESILKQVQMPHYRP